MDDPPLGAEGADVLPPAEAAAPADLERSAGESGCKLSVGARWRGFHVAALVPGRSPHVFEATDIGQMEDVLIVATPVTKATEWRKGAWQKLCTQMPPEARILGCKEAFAEDGWRYEVMHRPPATSLREWMSSHHADGGTHKILLEQLTGALSALHSSGIVHLNIRPETIYVDEKGDHIDLVLGGLEAAALYNQSNLAVPDLDPFYAPPEAVDPAGLKSGIGLCAWDWWTLGRVIQELVLGRHVMSVLFGSDVIREPSAQLREQAQSLLEERDPPGVRAGAVEAMSQLDPAMEMVLHGLLTTVRAARWGGDLVRRWLAKEKVSHHYDLARDTRFFTWQGRGFSLPEAVEFFSTEENWADGEENIFNPQNPETLANFLSTVPEHKADWQKVRQIHTQMEAPEWSAVPASARRTVTTALAWLALGPSPGSLMLRGRRIDAAGLAALLSDNRNYYNCANVHALMSALALIQPLDPAAAEILTHLAAVGHEALRRAGPPRWVDPEDLGGQAHLLKLALEPATALQARADRVRAVYATNQDPEIARMLADKQPAAWANVLLIITAADPRRFGYVTKAEHARQQLAGMQTRSEKLRVAVFWLRLRRMLLSGGPFTGRWQIFAGCWFVLVGLGAVVARDAATTLGLAVGLVALRLLCSWRVGVLVRRCDQAAKPWSWRDGPGRCVQEAQRIWPEATAIALPGLTRQLAVMEGEMAELAPADHPALLQTTPLLAGLWLGLAVGSLLCVWGSVRLVVRSSQAARVQVANFSQVKSWENVPENTFPPAPVAAHGLDEALLAAIPGLTAELREKLARGEYEIVEEGFGKTLHGPIIKWDLFSSAAAAPLPVEARVRATPTQRAHATVSAELLLLPYGHKAVKALLVVPVPARDKFAVMLYNARDHELVDDDTLVLRDPLAERTWYKIGKRAVVYLGAPAETR